MASAQKRTKPTVDSLEESKDSESPPKMARSESPVVAEESEEEILGVTLAVHVDRWRKMDKRHRLSIFKEPRRQDLCFQFTLKTNFHKFFAEDSEKFQFFTISLGPYYSGVEVTFDFGEKDKLLAHEAILYAEYFLSKPMDVFTKRMLVDTRHFTDKELDEMIICKTPRGECLGGHIFIEDVYCQDNGKGEKVLRIKTGN